MNRRTLSVFLALCVLVAPQVFAQDSSRVLEAYQQQFQQASPAGKYQILQSADRATPEELGPLWVQAVQFVLSNSNDISSDQLLQDIALYAIDRIEEGSYDPAARLLWTLFEEFGGNTMRIRILETLREVGSGNAELILDLNGWVQAQVSLFRGGVSPDLQVFRNAIITVGALSDNSSFPMLLDAQLAGISQQISDDARAAMEQLPGDYVELAIDTTTDRLLAERLPALEYFVTDESLSDEEQARVAAAVLTDTVTEVLRDPTAIEAQRQLRYRAVQVLARVSYPDATFSLIRHFDLTFADYDRGRTTKTWVLEAIAALGNTGARAAAVRLTAFLDLLNTYTERDRPYDTQIMLAVITNLGRIGEEVAYDSLFYVDLLNYPRRVKDAAEEALDAITN